MKYLVTLNELEYKTVSALSYALKRKIEGSFGSVHVRGEISGYRGPHASGHIYFSLKDEKARLDCIMWRSTVSRQQFSPEEGLEVIVSGRLSIYPGASRYQLIIDVLKPTGEGALMALLEERKKKFAAEGLFDRDRKKNLPFLPKVIGVVTSPTGAVIRDIIHRISERFPIHILVWPVQVQGKTSSTEIAAAISGFNDLDGKGAIAVRPDLIIVARGGGNIEDLWSFNEEIVVRTVAKSVLPVISAIGHETDWTLIDYVSDLRAPTPTGAAEIAVPVKADLETALVMLNSRLYFCISRLINDRQQRLKDLARGLPYANHLLTLAYQNYDEITNRLSNSLIVSLKNKKRCLNFFLYGLSSVLFSRSLREKQQNNLFCARRLQQFFILGIRHRKFIYLTLAGRFHCSLLHQSYINAKHKFNQVIRRMENAFQNIYRYKQNSFDKLCHFIKILSYEEILDRGFALVINSRRKLVKKARNVSKKDTLILRFSDGELHVKVNTVSIIDDTE